MEIARNRIEAAAGWIFPDHGQFVRATPFDELLGQLQVETALREARGEPPDETRVEVERQLRFIRQDIWNIETICERLEWQCGLWNSAAITDMQWGRFASSDIALFHVEYRSIFDYLARIFSSISDKPGQTRVESFRKLLERIQEKQSFANRVGTDITDLVKRCDWFMLLRKFRDLIAHRGGETLVFLDKPRILFQLYDAVRWDDRQVDVPAVMHNQNVARFDLYAGVFYGYLIWYLAEAAAVIGRRLGVNLQPGTTRSNHPGLAVLQKWLAEVLALTAPTASAGSSGVSKNCLDD